MTPNATNPATNEASEKHRARSAYRPPAGIPLRRPDRWGTPVSVLVHAIILVLLIVPFTRSRKIDLTRLGAGGLGPAGGGGGGFHGFGTTRAAASAPERLSFMEVAASPPTPAVVKPVVQLAPKVKPIKPTVQQVLQAVMPPKLDIKATAPKLPAPIMFAAGTSGGTGNDGTNGTGPGTGGGVGTGVGTGRGSGEGPGTGGGTGTIYPATPEFLVMPALPVPKHIQGRTIELRFTIDEHGNIIRVDFESSGDAGYDRQLRERLSEYRFRPAHRMDGTPVASVYVTQLTL